MGVLDRGEHQCRLREADESPAVRGASRAELVAALDRATAAKVTVISAPPGSGKTSLVRLWAAQVAAPRRVVSLSVRRGERDAQRLLTSLLREVDRAVGAAAEPAEPTPTAEFDAPALVERILDAFERSDTPVVLVIDDLHELQATDAYAALEALLDGLPEHVNVVLVSRRDPQLRLHHLRLAGQVSELRAADLRFSEEETGQLLAASGIALAEESVRELHRRTEGWAAGLRLAAIALGNHPSPETFVSAFSGTDRTVSEYLLAEMLERQPESVRRLLLRASIAERVTGPLADILSDGVGAQEVLRALEDANAFVISLDPGADAGFGSTTSSATCCAWSSIARRPTRSRSCTGAQRPGSPSTIGPSRRSATPRLRRTGRGPRGCWQTLRSGFLSKARRAPSAACSRPSRGRRWKPIRSWPSSRRSTSSPAARLQRPRGTSRLPSAGPRPWRSSGGRGSTSRWPQPGSCSRASAVTSRTSWTRWPPWPSRRRFARMPTSRSPESCARSR